MGVMKKIERKLWKKTKQSKTKQMVIKQRTSTISNFSLCISSICDLDVFFFLSVCVCMWACFDRYHPDELTSLYWA